MKQHTPVRMVISSGHSARFSSLFYPPTLSYSDYKPFITHCIIFIRCPLCDSYQMNDEVFLLFMHQQPAQSLPLTHRPFLMNASCVVFPLVLVVCVCVRAGCFFFLVLFSQATIIYKQHKAKDLLNRKSISINQQRAHAADSHIIPRLSIHES